MAEAPVAGDVKAAAALAVVLTLFAVIVGEEVVSFLLSPVIILAIVFVLVRAPIRQSMLAIMFVTLSIENPDEQPAAGLYQSPFFRLGAILLTHLKKTVDIPVLGSVCGVDLMLGLLLLVALFRKINRSNIDRVGRIETPKPLVQLALLSLVAIVWILFVGMCRGGDISMAIWQVDKVVHLPVIFLLFHLGLRGPKDHLAIARVVLGASLVKALFALYVVSTVSMPPDPLGHEVPLPWATSHHDSILFAMACVILISMMVERAGRSSIRLGLALLPILGMGMLANNRRMVWVQVAVVFATLYLATPSNRMKRKIKIASYALSPFILTYLSMGWDSKDGIFKPVQTIRSVLDPQTDASTLWRDMENYDILFTIKQYWVLGAGYGNGYWEIIPLPPIDYLLEKYLPHNSILGLWCFAGVLGYTAITLHWGVGVYFAMRAYRAAKKPSDRVAALACLGAVLIYMIQCYGDVGLGSWTGVFMVGSALAVAGKLAVSVGAWPSSTAAKKPAAAPVRATIQGQVA